MTGSRKKSARLKLKGGCTIYEISDLDKKISELLRRAPAVTLDLSSVERVDASFLQLLVSAQAEAERSQICLTLSNPADNVRALIESLYFHPLIDARVYPSDAGE